MPDLKHTKRRVNPQRYNDLVDRFLKMERRLVELEAERPKETVEPPAPKPTKPALPPEPPRPYDLVFPLDRGQWVSVRSNLPLEPVHWDRLFALLQLQRETLCTPEQWPAIIPDDAGILGNLAA